MLTGLLFGGLSGERAASQQEINMGVYVVGHMANWMFNLFTKATEAAPEGGASARLIFWHILYTFLPNLDNFGAQLTLASGRALSWQFLSLATTHSRRQKPDKAHISQSRRSGTAIRRAPAKGSTSLPA